MFKEINKTTYHKVCDGQRTIQCFQTFHEASLVAEILEKDYNYKNICVVKVEETKYMKETKA